MLDLNFALATSFTVDYILHYSNYDFQSEYNKYNFILFTGSIIIYLLFIYIQKFVSLHSKGCHLSNVTRLKF